MEDLTTLSSDKHSPEPFQINMRQFDYYMMMQKFKNDQGNGKYQSDRSRVIGRKLLI